MRPILSILVSLTLLYFVSLVDLEVSSNFYHEGFENTPFFRGVYYLGLVPAWALAIASCIGLCMRSWQKWRDVFLYLVLVMCLGCGFVVNVCLKKQWGRPRPNQVEQFGGNRPYQPFYVPHFSADRSSYQSFCSGHAAMGFYFFSLYFVGRYTQKRWLEVLGFVSAVCLGGLLAYTRIAQGGHFLSDTLFSMWVMWWISKVLSWSVFGERSYTTTKRYS